MKNKDVFFGIAVIIFAIAFFNQTLRLPTEPAMFPRILLTMILISGVGMIARALWQQKKGTAEEENKSKMSLKEFGLNALLPAGILIVMVYLMRFLGFYLGSFLLFIVIFIMQDLIINKRFSLRGKEIFKLILSTVGVTVLLYIVFSILLRLPTPIGPLGF